MSPTPPSASALRVADLSPEAGAAFALRPDAKARTQIARTLGLAALRKLSFEGRVLPAGKNDWRLKARLGATVVQDCVITLDPVTTRIDVDVTRSFIADFSEPEDPEAEMSEDDSIEALGAWIDPQAVMIEALSIAAPDYPRKAGAELGQMVLTEPGQAPMTDEDARPFAGLADLRDQLKKDDG